MSTGIDRRGFALILAIWALAAVALVTTVLATGVRRESTLTRNALDGAAARHLADAAVHLVAAALAEPAAAEQIRIDGTPMPLTIEGATVNVRVLDEGGKVDLNEAPAELLRGLLVTLGAKPGDASALATAIAAWREQRAAESRTNPIGSVRFESLGQLARINGMTPALLARLEPYVTVESRQPGIDPWVAPAEVLTSVPGIDPRIAANLVRDRPPAYHRQDGGRMAMPSNALLGPSHGNAFGIEASVEIAGLSFTRRAVFEPGRNGAEPRLLAWR